MASPVTGEELWRLRGKINNLEQKVKALSEQVATLKAENECLSSELSTFKNAKSRRRLDV